MCALLATGALIGIGFILYSMPQRPRKLRVPQSSSGAGHVYGTWVWVGTTVVLILLAIGMRHGRAPIVVLALVVQFSVAAFGWVTGDNAEGLSQRSLEEPSPRLWGAAVIAVMLAESPTLFFLGSAVLLTPPHVLVAQRVPV